MLVLAGLHAVGIAPLMWGRRPLTSVEHVSGNAYIHQLHTRWMSQEVTGDSPARLLEDGIPLEHGNAESRFIGERGAGRYSLRDGAIVFSASDNSDPRTNGRRYEIEWPWLPPVPLAASIVLFGMAGVVAAIVRWRHALRRLVAEPAYWEAALLYLAIAAVGRLWFFVEYRIPGLHGDSTSYFELVRTMESGQWPQFGIRTPGYPLFLESVLMLSRTTLAVVTAQTVLTLAAALLMVYAFYSYRRWLGMLAGAGMGVFTVGIWIFENDTSLLSDGPYSAALVCGLACLMVGISRARAPWLAAASTAFAAAILFRPAGAFLFVIYALVIVFLVWNKYRRPAIAAMALPLPAIMLALALYNWSTIGVFTLTAFGESQIAFATFTFWEEDPSYPANVNEAVRRTQQVMRTRLNDDSRRLIAGSWDFDRLAPPFLSGFYYPALTEASTLDGRLDYMAARSWIRRVSIDSIAKHRDRYAKFVATQLWLQFFSNPRYYEDAIAFIRNRISEIYATDKYARGVAPEFYQSLAMEWADRPAIAAFRVDGTGTDAEITIDRSSPLVRGQHVVMVLRHIIFGNALWTWLYVVTLIAATIQMVRTRGRHRGAFLALMLTLSCFGAALVVALVEYGGHRYSAPTQFVYYLPILPMLFIEPRDDREF